MGRYFRENNVFLIFLFLTLPLFFYKLDQSSLVSWDEAWHASIARNLMQNNNFFVMKFNGSSFYDHPPAGYWIISDVFRVFGVSELTARIVQAISGVLGLVFVYHIGKEMFSKYAGMFASLILLSAPWYLFRARSGNLDSIMIMFSLSTFLFALKLKSSRKYLYPFAISLAFLILTKSLLPLLFIPSYVFILKDAKLSKKLVVKIVLISFTPFAVWIVANLADGGLGHFNRLNSLVGKTGGGVFLLIENIRKAKTYIHNGIGIWFWPAVLALIAELILGTKKFLPFVIFLGFFLLPFVFVTRGELWHLMPTYPILALSLTGLHYFLFAKNKYKIFLEMIFGVIIIYYAIFQIRANWYNFINIAPFVSDEEILSRMAGKYKEKFYIDEDFEPAAIFYSGREVEQILGQPLRELFDSDEKFILITRQWRLDESEIEKHEYNLLGWDRDKLLILRNENFN